MSYQQPLPGYTFTVKLQVPDLPVHLFQRFGVDFPVIIRIA